VKIYVNGKQLKGSLVYVAADRLLLPVRSLFEAMGATVDYRADTKVVTASYRGHVVKMTVDSLDGFVDGSAAVLDIAPVNIDGKVYIPLRFAGEALGATVDYNASARTVKVTAN